MKKSSFATITIVLAIINCFFLLPLFIDKDILYFPGITGLIGTLIYNDSFSRLVKKGRATILDYLLSVVVSCVCWLAAFLIRLLLKKHDLRE